MGLSNRICHWKGTLVCKGKTDWLLGETETFTDCVALDIVDKSGFWLPREIESALLKEMRQRRKNTEIELLVFGSGRWKMFRLQRGKRTEL